MPIHRSIPAKDVPMVKGMLLRNDPQQDIAWYVGVNNSRVNELKRLSTGYAQQFADVPPTPPEELPPPGPHPSAREFYEFLTVEKMLTEAAIGLATWQSDIRQSQAEAVIADLRWELERAKAANTDLRREAEENKAIAAEAIANMNAIEAEKNQALAERDQALKSEKQGWGAKIGWENKARDTKASQREQQEEMEKELKAGRDIIEGVFARLDSTLEKHSDKSKPKREKTWVSDRPPKNGHAK